MDNITIDHIKRGAGMFVGFGTSNIVRSAIIQNVAVANPITRISVTVASVVIGMMAAEKTSAYTEEIIQTSYESFNENVAQKTSK